MTSRRSALRTWVVPPTFISDNPRLRRSSTIENRHNANTPWPPGRRHLAGRRSRSVTDWRPATPQMRFWSIDDYLATLNVLVDELGGAVDLVGLCQGGWMALIYAARFPGRVRKLVLA